MGERIFEDRAATRERTPLLVGVIGPSGTGKTYSALRLATGIQRVAGGEIYLIDTEARRALHYADKFKFRHVAFGAPFSPLDYLAAVEHCVKKGARTVVIDSMSHEHEGPGGLLEMHAAELERMGGSPSKSMMAWQKPKAARRRLINTLLQLECNFVFCFRAKDKVKLIPGAREPVALGFMPIAGEEFVYELTLKCLLLPGANGVPTLSSGQQGEQLMIKIPEQFKALLSRPEQLSEDLGEKLAQWAAGTSGSSPRVTLAGLLASYAACSDAATLRVLEQQRESVWAKCDEAKREKLLAAFAAAEERITAPTADEPPPGALATDEPEPGADG